MKARPIKAGITIVEALHLPQLGTTECGATRYRGTKVKKKKKKKKKGTGSPSGKGSARAKKKMLNPAKGRAMHWIRI